MSSTATTATLEQASLLDLLIIYNGLSDEETECSDWENNKESLLNEVKKLAKKYGYNGPNNYTALYWFCQGIETERLRNKADIDLRVGYEHSYYPCRTKETILEKLKNFYNDIIENHPNILRCKTIHITF